MYRKDSMHFSEIAAGGPTLNLQIGDTNMGRKKNTFSSLAFRLVTSLIITTFTLAPQTVRAADHRDSGAVDAIPEGDLTDVFAFIDPANNANDV